MDSFKEQIIKKQATNKDNVTRVLIILATLALAFAIVFISILYPKIFVMGIFLACASIYGGVYLMQNLSVEYEYIFTNGDLDVDKILAARSRKRLITVKVGDATDIGPCDDHSDGGKTLVLASAFEPEMQDYYLDVKHKSYGEVRVIFTPDDDMLMMIKSHLPRSLRSKINLAPKDTVGEQ